MFVKHALFDAFKDLGSVPMRNINRNFLFVGEERIGKTSFIQGIHNWLKEGEKETTIAGWKTGDLRLFNYELAKI